MDDHTDTLASPPETWPRRFIKLFGPPLCVLATGLIMTALAERESTTIAWVYGVLISGFAAFVCALVTFRWHRQTEVCAAIREELEALNLQLNNVQTEKHILRQALQDSEQRSRDLVSLSGGIVCELDEHGKAGFVSAAVSDLLGFYPSDLAGVAVDSLISEPDRNAFDQILKAARQERQLQRANLNLIDVDQRSVPSTLRVLVLHDTLHGFSGFRLSMQPPAGSQWNNIH